MGLIVNIRTWFDTNARSAVNMPLVIPNGLRAPGIPPASQALAIQQAASRYDVPLTAMYGVYSNETSLGSAINTSSTGAVGPFQFEPSTAAKYGYPLTNRPTPAQFTQQANATARYLADLYNQLGKSWTNALGGYYAGPGAYSSSGAQQYATKALNSGRSLLKGFGPVAPGLPALGAAAGSIADSTGIPSTIGDVFNAAVGDAKYAAVLVVAIVLGAALMLHGLRGGSSSRAVAA